MASVKIVLEKYIDQLQYQSSLVGKVYSHRKIKTIYMILNLPY